MLLLKVSDQLGNQMFAYAAVKSIAIDKGYRFGLLPCSENTSALINDRDSKYGHTIDTIFPTVADDVVRLNEDDIKNYAYFRENIDKNSVSALDHRSYEINDNTLMEGHYVSAGYFERRLDEVRKWFTFPEDIVRDCTSRYTEIRKKANGRKIVAVHFRVGKDYRKGGFLLEKNYWERAAEECRMQLAEYPLYMIFYDSAVNTVRRFKDRHDCIEVHGSLIYDLCMMTMADANIICNSSFSMMGALLNPGSGVVVCPSSYPVPYGKRPDGTYPKEWIMVKAGHDRLSYLYFKLRMTARCALGMRT